MPRKSEEGRRKEEKRNVKTNIEGNRITKL